MNRSAHRGDSLTWKTTAMAAALVALVAAAALLAACAEDRPNGAAGQFAVASPAIPQKAAEDDPDSFARTHTAAEVQEYIRANEEDFLTFKAKLLLKDAAGDPIKKAALINDMVQSIVQIPDPIQRSVYIKECARIMDIDENLLIAEVGRKRMASTGDREAEEFVRRQSARFRAEQTAQRPETVFAGQVTGGSSAEALETGADALSAQVRSLFVRFQGGPECRSI